MTPIIELKRAYDPELPDDGFRIYVDRLWPRGLSKESFRYDWWDKTIAPSAKLRKWFHENPKKDWNEFERRYAAEIHANPAFAELKKTIADKSKVTLLYSSRDREHNNARVLKNCMLLG
ncbi:MAG: DUF488 family protein [Clostridium sp.]|nr:DUF488 family protein [Prevotella sp.]MCM1429670.1 DUF488 family protein [Clostridium sp.]MCM1476175.1 DUF488 family protein [Muribaculaceae bacterium]